MENGERERAHWAAKTDGVVRGSAKEKRDGCERTRKSCMAAVALSPRAFEAAPADGGCCSPRWWQICMGAYACKRLDAGLWPRWRRLAPLACITRLGCSVQWCGDFWLCTEDHACRRLDAGLRPRWRRLSSCACMMRFGLLFGNGAATLDWPAGWSRSRGTNISRCVCLRRCGVRWRTGALDG